MSSKFFFHGKRQNRFMEIKLALLYCTEIYPRSQVLIHTACPIEIALDGSPPTQSREELEQSQFEPAVRGTTALLEAAARAGIRKVVLTSSIGAMRYQVSVMLHCCP